MRATFPVLPIGLGAVSRAATALAAVAVAGLKIVARTYRNRQQARALAGLDRRMLADMGINHADLRDAFSSPIWEDPTELLQERASERRSNRSLAVTSIVSARQADAADARVEPGFHRPPLTRSARALI